MLPDMSYFLYQLSFDGPVHFGDTSLGGGLELAQKYLTTCRSGEWLDFMANSAGVVLAALVAVILARVCRD